MAVLAEECTLFFCVNKTSAIIDTNFTEYAENSQMNAVNYGASLLLVRTVCSDKIAIQRLRVRSKSRENGGSAATEGHFAEIKANIAEFPKVKEAYYEIATTVDISSQLKKPLGWSSFFSFVSFMSL